MSVPASSSQLPVLIFLESNDIASRIQSALNRYGLKAVAITPGQITQSRDVADWRLVITYTAMIGRVRSLLDLPVINIETFIFDSLDETGNAGKRQFDGAAFIKRVFSVLSAERRLA